MKLRLTIELTRDQPPATPPVECDHPQGDVYASTERLGFQPEPELHQTSRQEPFDDE